MTGRPSTRRRACCGECGLQAAPPRLVDALRVGFLDQLARRMDDHHLAIRFGDFHARAAAFAQRNDGQVAGQLAALLDPGLVAQLPVLPPHLEAVAPWPGRSRPAGGLPVELEAHAARDRAHQVTRRTSAQWLRRELDARTGMGGDGGVITLDGEGRIAMPFNTRGMYRGAVATDGTVTVAIYADEPPAATDP